MESGASAQMKATGSACLTMTAVSAAMGALE